MQPDAEEASRAVPPTTAKSGDVSLPDSGDLNTARKEACSFLVQKQAARKASTPPDTSRRAKWVETIEFDRAVHAVYQSLSAREREETLMIVTADHLHTSSISGYPTRGNPILGKLHGNDRHGNPKKEPEVDEPGLPCTTLSYAGGPGSTAQTIHTKRFTTKRGGLTTDGFMSLLVGRTRYVRSPVGPRPDLDAVDTAARKLVQEGPVPMKLETRGGEDVVIDAKGPGSHLFRGTREQNCILHAIQQAPARP